MCISQADSSLGFTKELISFYKRNHFFLTDKLEFSIKPFTVCQSVYLFKQIIHSKYTP